MANEQERVYKTIELFTRTVEMLKDFYWYLPGTSLGSLHGFCGDLFTLLIDAQACDIDLNINESMLKDFEKLKSDGSPLLFFGLMMDGSDMMESLKKKFCKYYLSENGDILPLDEWDSKNSCFGTSLCQSLIKTNYNNNIKAKDNPESHKLFGAIRCLLVFFESKLNGIYWKCRDEFLIADTNTYPSTKLILAKDILEYFRNNLLCEASAEGPYLPTGKFADSPELWQRYDGQVSIDLGVDTGTLKVRLDPTGDSGVVECEFTPYQGKVTNWEIDCQSQFVLSIFQRKFRYEYLIFELVPSIVGG
ncbi:MAG: hypothetical protein ABII09_12600 [Planctomycetota bacterium]